MIYNEASWEPRRRAPCGNSRARVRFALYQPGHQQQRQSNAAQIDPRAVRQATGRYHQHRRRQQQQLSHRQRRRLLLRFTLGQDQESETGVQHHDRQQDAECPAPGVQFGKNPAHRRPHQRRNAPHRRHQCHRARPQLLLKDQIDHGVGQRKDQTAAKPLHRSADQHHRHRRRQRAQHGSGDKKQRRHQIGAACAIAAEQPRG